MKIYFIFYVRPKYKTRIRAKGAAGEHKRRKGESVFSRVLYTANRFNLMRKILWNYANFQMLLPNLETS